MEKIYLPRADQFDLMNENLAKIANALCSNLDLTSWSGIQKAVRIGVAPDLIPVGTQLAVNHSVYGTHLYDVVAHNHFKSAHDKNAHTMTLMCHDNLEGVQFDSSEAFYHADAELPAGTYNFTIESAYSSWSAGTYQFTLLNALPVGGQLAISGYADSAMTDRTVRAYVSRTSTVVAESATITFGNGGTSLGVFGKELNHTQRVSYGSDNYKESAIRQFLNSPSVAGGVWVAQTKFDRPPSWVNTLAGFMGGFDDDFLSVVGEVVVPCATNNTYESPDSTVAKNTRYTINDKFYLASQRELFGVGADTVEDGTLQFPYYESATNADRIKYRNGYPTGWWMRSPISWFAGYVRIVDAKGVLHQGGVCNANGFIPACTIV